MKKIFKEAHKMTKEIVEKYNDVDYQAQFALCLQYLIEEQKLETKKQKDNELISYDEWLQEFNENQKGYMYLFYKNDILAKNGKKTESQYVEQEITTSTYNIRHPELDAMIQEAHTLVIEYFQRVGGKIKYGHRLNLWSLCSLNACKKIMKEIKRCKRAVNPHEPMPVGFNDKQEQVAITDDRREISYLKMDIEKLYNDGILTKRQMRIIQLIEQGFNQIEIADIVGISRQYVYKERQKIKQLMIDHELVVGY